MASYGKSTNCSGVAKQRNGAPESLLNLTNFRLEPNYQA